MKMYEVCCDSCFSIFTIPKLVEEHLRDSGETLYCPKGCGLSFEKKKKDVCDDSSITKSRLAATKRSLSATQGVVTKLRNRIRKLNQG